MTGIELLSRSLVCLRPKPWTCSPQTMDCCGGAAFLFHNKTWTGQQASKEGKKRDKQPQIPCYWISFCPVDRIPCFCLLINSLICSSKDYVACAYLQPNKPIWYLAKARLTQTNVCERMQEKVIFFSPGPPNLYSQMSVLRYFKYQRLLYKLTLKTELIS